MRMNPVNQPAQAARGQDLAKPALDAAGTGQAGRDASVIGDTRSGMSALADQVEASLVGHGGAVHCFDTGRSLDQLVSPRQDVRNSARLTATSGDRP